MLATNQIAAVGQSVQLAVPSGSYATISLDGTFTGTLTFYLNGAPVSLYNITGGTAGSATAAGMFVFVPFPGSGGILKVQATAWTSGTAVATISTNAPTTPLYVQLLPAGTVKNANFILGDFANPGYRGLRLVIYNTAVSGSSPTMTPLFRSKDTASNIYGNINGSLANVTSASVFYAYGLHPNFPTDTTNGYTNRISNILTSIFDISFTLGGSTPSFTCSMSMELLP